MRAMQGASAAHPLTPPPKACWPSVYGLTELHRAEVAAAASWATPAVLPCRPSWEGRRPSEGTPDRSELDHLRCQDRGVRAGIKPAATFHYPLRYENMNAYKIAAHQHNFEIERELSLVAGRRPEGHAHDPSRPDLPGDHDGVYGQLSHPSTTAEQLYEAYADFYPARRSCGSNGKARPRRTTTSAARKTACSRSTPIPARGG